MSMWLTVTGLGAITLLSVQRHLRRNARRTPAAGSSRPTCPRCGVHVSPSASACARCGVPLQLYDLVSAPVANEANDDVNAPPRALVRADLCVGCGVCVSACPEPGALTMQGKLAV